MLREILINLFKFKKLIFFFVNLEIKIKQRESVLGIQFKILTGIILIIIMSFYFDKGLYAQKNYFGYLIFGYFLWLLFSDTLNESSQLLNNYSHLLINSNINPLIIILKNLIINVYIFIITLIPQIIYLFYLGKFSFYFFGNFFIFFIFTLNLLFLSIIISILNLHYKIIDSLIKFGVFLMFLFTPIIYSKNILSSKIQDLLIINPLHHFLTLYRGCFLGFEKEINYSTSILFIIIFTLVSYFIANFVWLKFNKTIKLIIR